MQQMARQRGGGAVALLLCALLAAGARAASFSYSQRLANTTTIPLSLLHDPFADGARGGGGGRMLRAQMDGAWDEWKKIGRYSQIANPEMPGACFGGQGGGEGIGEGARNRRSAATFCP
jgi:hypothetical protein